MNNYKCIVSYDGSRFNGFQKQMNVKETIQEIMEKSIGEVLGETVEVIGSGRTDAGVHAIGQTISVKTSKAINHKIHMDINEKLPNSIVIKKIEHVEDRFHARYNATSKIYVYKILNKEISDPFERKYSYHVPEELNIEDMKKASEFLVGTHDFTSFSNIKTKKSAVKTIKYINFTDDNGHLSIEICGDGFLYNMVRIIVGALISVGEGALEVEDIRIILNAKEKDSKGFKAPARGLYLKSVQYDGKKTSTEE